MNGPDRRTVLKITGGAATMLASTQASAALPEIVAMDGRSLSAAIAGKKLSCVEVMTAYLDHIAVYNSKVNAIVALQDRGALLAQARERDEQLARGQVMGPLHGFPHAVKDLIPVKGIKSTSGSPILKDFVNPFSFIEAKRLEFGRDSLPECPILSKPQLAR